MLEICSYESFRADEAVLRHLFRLGVGLFIMQQILLDHFQFAAHRTAFRAHSLMFFALTALALYWIVLPSVSQELSFFVCMYSAASKSKCGDVRAAKHQRNLSKKFMATKVKYEWLSISALSTCSASINISLRIDDRHCFSAKGAATWHEGHASEYVTAGIRFTCVAKSKKLSAFGFRMFLCFLLLRCELELDSGKRS